MATQYEPIVKDSTLNTTESTPRNIADVLADETGDLVTQATAIVTKLQALINAVKPNASDIPLDPITGMTANNVQLGISELKGTLDEKLDNTVMFPSTSISDCNLAKTNGIHYYNTNSSNAPTTNGGIIFTCIIQPAQNQGFQLAFPNNQNYIAMRVLTTSAFGNWQPIINAGNINSYITTTTAFPMTISNKTGTSDCVIDTQNCYMKNNTAYIAMTLHSVSNTSDIEISLPSGKKFKQIGAIGTCGKGNRWSVTGVQYVFVGEISLSLNSITANTYYHLILALPLQ